MKLNNLSKVVRSKTSTDLGAKLEHLKKRHSQAKRDREQKDLYRVKWKHRFSNATIYLEDKLI